MEVQMFCVLVQVCLFKKHENISVKLFDHHTWIYPSVTQDEESKFHNISL